MTFSQPEADFYVPDGADLPLAVERTTHLAIGAHQDDLEFMAFHGIIQCHGRNDRWFGGVVCTDGRGSSRTGPFADYTDDQIREVRRQEQRDAAKLGGYSFMAQLDYPSSVVKNPRDTRLTADLVKILQAARPEIVYAHQPADKHETHVGVLRSTIEALRALPRGQRPSRVLGCEGWRDLDWMLDSDKASLDVSGHEDLANRLNALFASQIAGGKRYDLAVMGRRRANATFFDSHSGDTASEVTLAMDLTPLVEDDSLDVSEFTLQLIDRFRENVKSVLGRQFPSLP